MLTHEKPILVTGAAGEIGAIGRHLTAMLLAKGQGRYDRVTDDVFKLTGPKTTD